MTEAPKVRVAVTFHGDAYSAVKALYAKAREEIAALGGDPSHTPMSDIDRDGRLVWATFHYRPLEGEFADGA